MVAPALLGVLSETTYVQRVAKAQRRVHRRCFLSKTLMTGQIGICCSDRWMRIERVRTRAIWRQDGKHRVRE